MKKLFACCTEDTILFEVVITEDNCLFAVYSDGSIRPVTVQEYRIAMEG